MKLALKIVVICLIAMILITAFSIWLIAQREFDLVKEQHQSDAARLGNMIRESVDLVYQKEGQQGIVQAIKTRTVNTGMLTYRWVWFDVSVNDPNYPTASVDSLDEILAGKMDSVMSTGDGPKNMHTYFPLDVNDDKGATRKGAIEISGSLESAEQEAWRTIKTGMFAIAAMSLLCTAIVSWAGIRMVGRPLSSLIEHTRRIGDGDYNHPLHLYGHGEFGELATALNSMSQKIADQQQRIEKESAARIATMEQLRHADRLKTVGRLAAGIAHELGTPLNVVSGRAGLIRSGKLDTRELEESAAAIQSESNRIAGIVRQLMDFARHNPPRKSAVDLRILIERTIGLLKTLSEKNRVLIELQFELNKPFTAYVDESQIQQVLTNVIVNAIQAMPDGGPLKIRIENRELSTGSDEMAGFVQIDIQDSGVGMDAETRSQVFEPFFTTKETGQGTGLGLSIAQGIVEEHGGRIEIESTPGEGTTFRVLLPKAEKNSSNQEPA